MRKLKYLSGTGLLALATFFVSGLVTPFQAHAENLICKVFPFISSIQSFGIAGLCGTLSTTETANQISGYIKLALNLIFIGIIIIAIYIIIKAAIKYIRSEGDEGKIQESQKAIKSVFIGIAALFVGIIGIIIVLAFFNATGAVNQNTSTPNNFLNQLLGGGDVVKSTDQNGQ